MMVRLLVDGGLTPAVLHHRHCSRLLLRAMQRERLRQERVELLRLTLEQARGFQSPNDSPEFTKQLRSWTAELYDRLAAAILDAPEPKPVDRQQLGAEAKEMWEKAFASLDAPETAINIDRTVAALMARRK